MKKSQWDEFRDGWKTERKKIIITVKKLRLAGGKMEEFLLL